ncbi:MAG: 2-hydroxyacid dehydrogenase [Streptosporangiaceae bacterium]|nr:2-hydroxyacid dehydrogenase [Streptosporangiaceae bacterium]MBV9857797.1 2-hydroxyacid dehydrogenase [Streptosporangiaceae bacterium]
MRIWVPAEWVAAGLTGLPGTEVEIVDPDGTGLPASSAEVEFYVPSFFPSLAGAEAMAQMPRLRVVQALTAGVDKLRPYVPDGAVLCNARGAHDASTAEWVVAAMLAAIRGFPGFALDQSERRWNYHHTDALAEKTVLIVGYGSIGAAVERRLAGFDVTVLRVARAPRDGVAGIAGLPALLPRADVVVVLVPFTAETAGMVDAAFLARMRDGALLVNAARGAVVDTGALVAELSSGRLRAAADVTDPEPLPPEHPLWTAPGVFITPHVAASTPVSTRRVVGFVRSQAEAYLRGEPLRNVITDTY